MAESREKSIPVLNTRNVLLEHLLAKITPYFSSPLNAKKAVLGIVDDIANQEIIRLLENENELLVAVSETSEYKREKEELGEELYCNVAEIEPDLCAKITGMLLELDNSTIRGFLTSDDLLEKAVEKSKKKYLVFTEESREKEVVGESLYELALSEYSPQVASQLTGMLLELELEELKKLTTNRVELGHKLKLAHDALIRFQST